MSLDGGVAFVSGSTRGIGRAIAARLQAEGAAVVLNGSSSRQRLDVAVEELGAAGGVLADFGDPAAVSAAFGEIFKQHRRLDVMVNNAAILEDGLLGMIGSETAERTFAVNALGVLHGMQNAARLMRREE